MSRIKLEASSQCRDLLADQLPSRSFQIGSGTTSLHMRQVGLRSSRKLARAGKQSTPETCCSGD